MPLKDRPETKPVDVRLDALFPAAGQAATVDGLKLEGWTAGALHRWLRSSTGQWISVCTVLIERTDGTIYKAEDQLIPASALRPRDDGAARKRPSGER